MYLCRFLESILRGSRSPRCRAKGRCFLVTIRGGSLRRVDDGAAPSRSGAPEVSRRVQISRSVLPRRWGCRLALPEESTPRHDLPLHLGLLTSYQGGGGNGGGTGVYATYRHEVTWCRQSSTWESGFEAPESDPSSYPARLKPLSRAAPVNDLAV
jgi:hypothetical protein